MTNREEFRKWAEANSYNAQRIASEAGVTVDLAERCLYAKTGSDFKPERMTPAYRKRLHDLTKLPMFKPTSQTIAGPKVDLTKLFPWQRDLLQWMADQDLSRGEVATRAGIVTSNMNVYCTQPCDPDRLLKKNRVALYNLTSLKSLDGAVVLPPAAAVAVPNNEVVEKLDRLVEAVGRLEQRVDADSVVPASDADLVNRTIDALTRLVGAVEHYKTRTAAVDLLRTAVPKRDMGYVLAALNALYSSDDMGSWLLRTSKPIEVGSWKRLE